MHKEKDLELGQMLFGNPTQEYPVPREEWMRGPFEILMDAIAEKTGDKNFIYDPDFSNDFFTIRRYYWGEEEWGADGLWEFVDVNNTNLSLKINSMTIS